MMKQLKTYVLTLILSFTGAFALAEEVPENVPGSTLVTAEYLSGLKAELPLLVMIDNQSQYERDQGYIPGSVSMTEEEINPETLTGLAGSKEAPIVFYCSDRQCMSSVYAVRLALKEGYKQVYWFKGGLTEWRQLRFPVAHAQ